MLIAFTAESVEFAADAPKQICFDAGGNLDLELGYRIRRVRPLWTVRASGSYTRNFLLTDKSPEFGAGSTSASELINTLPLEFAAAGVAAMALLGASFAATATRVAAVSPQGEVAVVRQVVVRGGRRARTRTQRSKRPTRVSTVSSTASML
mgnify:CR=1 FL=1